MQSAAEEAAGLFDEGVADVDDGVGGEGRGRMYCHCGEGVGASGLELSLSISSSSGSRICRPPVMLKRRVMVPMSVWPPRVMRSLPLVLLLALLTVSPGSGAGSGRFISIRNDVSDGLLSGQSASKVPAARRSCLSR